MEIRKDFLTKKINFNKTSKLVEDPANQELLHSLFRYNQRHVYCFVKKSFGRFVGCMLLYIFICTGG